MNAFACLLYIEPYWQGSDNLRRARSFFVTVTACHSGLTLARICPSPGSDYVQEEVQLCRLFWREPYLFSHDASLPFFLSTAPDFSTKNHLYTGMFIYCFLSFAPNLPQNAIFGAGKVVFESSGKAPKRGVRGWFSMSGRSAVPEKKKRSEKCTLTLCFLVAGRGFEPLTSGL